MDNLEFSLSTPESFMDYMVYLEVLKKSSDSTFFLYITSNV